MWRSLHDDDQTAYCGGNQDLTRIGNADCMPVRDRPGKSSSTQYGSAHAYGWSAAFCDGSVRMMNYDIDAETHTNLSSRNDGKAISAEKF